MAGANSRRLVLSTVCVGLLSTPVFADPAFKRLPSAEIRKAITGKEITDGFHWSDSFHGDGKGKYTTLGRPKEGPWEIKDDMLCMVSHSRRNDNIECFEVWRSAGTIQYRQPGNGAVIAEGQLKPLAK